VFHVEQFNSCGRSARPEVFHVERKLLLAVRKGMGQEIVPRETLAEDLGGKEPRAEEKILFHVEHLAAGLFRYPCSNVRLAVRTNRRRECGSGLGASHSQPSKGIWRTNSAS
jgi:hypothetical protein